MTPARLAALVLGAALVLTGCQSAFDRQMAALDAPPPPPEADSVLHDRALAQASRADDPYAGIRVLKLPVASGGNRAMAVALVQFAQKDGSESSTLFVTYAWGAWAYLDHIIDLEGRRFDDPAPRRDVIGANVVENLTFDVSPDWLEGHRATGAKLRAYGNSGYVDLEVPGWYIAAFIDAAAAQPDMGAAYRVAPAAATAGAAR